MEDLTGKAVEDGFAFQCKKLTRADLAALQVEAPDEEMYRVKALHKASSNG